MDREYLNAESKRMSAIPDSAVAVPIPVKLWIAAILIAMPSFLFGYISAALNSCLVTGDGQSVNDCYDNNDDERHHCPPGTVYNDIKLTNTLAQLATALMVLGAWIGCLVGNIPMEKFGRRSTALWNNVFFIVGALFCASGNEALLFLGRFIAGFGVGVGGVVIPVLLSEIAPKAHRGTITTMHQLLLTGGIFMASVVGYGLVMYVNHGWQYLQASIAIPSLVMILGSALIPESPKWLIQRSRHDDAAASLRLVRSLDTDVYAELAELISEAKADESNSASEVTWAEVFACKQAMVIGCGLMTFGALSGINTVIFYSTTIFAYAGFDEAILASVSVGAVNLLSTILAMYLVDILGRKTLLSVGTQFMTGALFLLSTILLTANGNTEAQGAIAVVAVLIFVFGFAVGIGAVSWVVMAEIMHTRLRSKAFSLFVSLNWGSNLIIGMLTLTAIEGLGGTTSDMDDDERDKANKKGVAYLYFIVATVCVVTVLFIQKYVPETKGKTPDDFLSNRTSSGGVMSPLLNDADGDAAWPTGTKRRNSGDKKSNKF